jgi:ketosteroid isomerase-like protein
MSADASQDEVRAAFEAHCRDMLPDMSLEHVNYADEDDNKTWGDYVCNDIEWMWNGWQAAWQAARLVALEEAERLAFTSKGYPTEVSKAIRALAAKEDGR